MTAATTTDTATRAGGRSQSTTEATDTSCSSKAATTEYSADEFTIRPFDPSSSSSASDLAQIRSLFVSGMTVSNAPQEYIDRSFQSDLKDVHSMNDTYLGSGRGTFVLLERTADKDGNNCAGSAKCEIVGMVGLQDISSTTGTNSQQEGGKEGEKEKDEICNQCELRRMSVHPSYCRCGLGAKLIEACISHAKLKEFYGIKLSTGAWMEAAIKFYMRQGFIDKGQINYQRADGSRVPVAQLEMIF